MSNVALTTSFTAPSSCFNNAYTLPPAGGSVYVKDFSIASSECYPSGFHSLFAAGVPYSPGVCPFGYTHGPATSYSNDATAALCCPSQWTMTTSDLGCRLMVNTPSVLALPTGSVTLSEGVLAMHGVYIAWKSKGLSSFAPAPASARPTIASSTKVHDGASTSTAHSAFSIAQTTTSEQTTGRTSSRPAGTTATVFVTPGLSPEPHQRLSAKGKAGVAVGAAVVGIATISIAIWTVLRRKRRKAWFRDSQASHEKQPPEDQAFEIADATVFRKGHLSELSSEGALSELFGSSPAKAAHSRQIRAELEGH